MEEFEIPKPPRTNYLNAEFGLKSWLLTKDHKRIGLLYLGAVSFFFFIGSIYAMMIRLELLTPQGDLMQSSTYNKTFTQHGIIMVFFFLIPSIPATATFIRIRSGAAPSTASNTSFARAASCTSQPSASSA